MNSMLLTVSQKFPHTFWSNSLFVVPMILSNQCVCCCHCSETRNELSIVPHLSLHVSVLEMNRTCFFFLYLVRTGNDLMASILSLRDSSTPSNIAHVHVSTLWHCNLTLWRFHWQTSLLQFLSSSYCFRSSSRLSSLLTLALFLSSCCLFSCFLDY